MTQAAFDQTAFDIDSDALIAFTQELVRVRSVNDPEAGTAEAEAAALVEAKMRSFGWEPHITEVAPGRPNVIAIIDGGQPGPTLMFEGHTDVVTEGDITEWSFDPYGAEIRDGKLLGRGSADMKSGVAGMIFAARAMQTAGPFPGRIIVGALADEEGMMLGAKAFAATALAKDVDGAIICEPEDGEVCNVSKGAIRMRIQITGKMAHGAMPQHGRNPIPVAATIVGDLLQLEKSLNEKHGTHPMLGDNYITPTVIAANTFAQINVIPRRCEFAVDIRTTTDIDHETLITRIHALIDKAATAQECAANMEIIDDRPPVDTPRESSVVAALFAAHRAVVGADPQYGGVPGTTDGTILTRDAKMPTVVYGPGDKWIAHQANEWVAVKDIVSFAHIYAEAAHRFLTSKEN